MRINDTIGTAIGNTFRSKTRTLLTVLAIFVGAFTLTLTSALGAGINGYITETVDGFGVRDVMSAYKEQNAAPSDEPQEYEPADRAGADGRGAQVAASYLTQDDLDDIADIEGVESVEPTLSTTVDSIARDGGTPYSIMAVQLVPGQNLQLDEGETPAYESGRAEVAIPAAFVDALGFDDASSAVGEMLTLGVSDADGDPHAFDARITGVIGDGFAMGMPTNVLSLNRSAAVTISALNQLGMADELTDLYTNAFVHFDAAATDAEIEALQDRLADAGFASSTVQQQLGMITSAVDGIVFVLNAFAIIALLAAAFGIVNTLYMSVQERTREIGLMKAIGLGSGHVFGLFSIEAVFIGLLGSTIGVLLAVLAALGVSAGMAGSFLADFDGLQLFRFEPVAIAATVATILLLAFLAGTLPAVRAARQDPVTSLRYE
ncbi:ABC transporter permease [Microbacterium esteraromaticum]|uniref:ABC transporter permease n=1 Tax=Microbacterium esteraromaticum TaxID=57043 RepID=UPI001A8FB09B|nr:ABC transporter permease [Microbacterium esteraromaticum]MBN8425309.1 ABC transporter permease [Microbacterium esteraromaticum]